MPRPENPTRAGRMRRSPVLRRNLILASSFAAWMVLIFARLYYLQIIEYAHWLERAEGQQQRTIELAPHRGAIYDRHMHALAMSLPVNSIYAVPSQLIDPHTVAGLLAPILGLESRDLEGRFAAFRNFCWVKRKVSAGEAARVKALQLKGIYFQKESKRFYPMGELAASVLGYVGMDDRGLAGLEYALNSQIQGRPGHALVLEDAHRQTFGSKDDPGEPGMNVELTLDSGIQYIAQSVLTADVAKWRAKGGVAIVENPRNGAVLAMASDPTFNPNDYAKSPPQDRINRGVSWIYEPGSTFKLVTVASAIQEGLAKPTDLIDCQMGAIVLGGRTIHDDRGAIRHELSGDLTLSQVLAYSSDVGAVKMALRLGEDRFYKDIREFGFGARTGIGLPGEEQGLLMPPDRWSGVSIGELAIGQGIGITPIQLVEAYSAIANGGVSIEPRIVQNIFNEDAEISAPEQWQRRIVSSRTAAELRDMLEGVVAFGTGTAARLDGYSAAGKTGTAQKIDPGGRYSHTHYVASFIGFAPATRPAVTILVAIDTPVGSHYGAEVAAPAWNEIAQQTLNYLGVPHDAPLTVPKSPALEMAASRRLHSAGPEADPPAGLQGPDELAANPNPGSTGDAEFRQNKSVMVLNDGPSVTVPDFIGLDERRVAEECQAMGLEVTMSGSGLAVQQNPAAGVKAPEGSRVQVVFSR
jgi:cell division protein FtsI (penicillin-binding protein 3)